MGMNNGVNSNAAATSGTGAATVVRMMEASPSEGPAPGRSLGKGFCVWLTGLPSAGK